MMRCIQIAKNGLGTSYPNPLVGCVIVHKQNIIGEGWHKLSGLPHAEVNALNSVKNKQLLKEATIYINLEPCSHFGKTPPCANLILKIGIKNIVIGSTDPNPKVAGKGIKLLKENGCKVTVGILEEKCNELNKRFFTYYKKSRPYIILKWAESLDGLIAPKIKDENKPVWISNKYSRQLVHQWRAEEQAILVGTKTVIDDNPSLTTRDWYGKSPIRIVLDKNLRIVEQANIFDDNSKIIILTEKAAINKKNLYFETIDFSKNIAEQICGVLFKYQIHSVIIEGGGQTLQTFINEKYWDEARVFKGDKTFIEGTKAPIMNGKLLIQKKIKNDQLYIYRND